MPILKSWKYWFASWFDAELFWVETLTNEMHEQALALSIFGRDAARKYVEHHERLREGLMQQGRNWLYWGVEDWWYVYSICFAQTLSFAFLISARLLAATT